MGIIGGLDHVDIRVPELAESIRFYVEGLGLTLQRQTEHNAVLYASDNTVVELSDGGTREYDMAGITHICYTVGDIEETFRRALAFGAVPSRLDMPVPKKSGDLYLAFVRAPGGEEVEFWQARTPQENERAYVRELVHVALTVPDVQAGVRFYEALGARLRSDFGFGCALSLPDGREIELFPNGEICGDQPKAYKHFCLITDDVDEAFARAQALGARPWIAPKAFENVLLCFVKGLFGETIEFFQPLPGRESAVFPAFPGTLSSTIGD